MTSEMPSERPFKVCPGCGRKFTQRQWAQLAYIGLQPTEDEGSFLELRNCACLSTIAVAVSGEVPERR